MEPKNYTGKEWQELIKEMTPQQIKKAMRSGLRGTAKKMVKEAQDKLASSGLRVEGNKKDWKKGIRGVATYGKRDKEDGITLTVKPARGKRELGYHENRRYGKTITRGIRSGNINQRKLPILMWAEDGTRQRNVGNRIGKSSFFSKSRWSGKKVRNYKRGGHSTGSMPAYGFLEKATPGAYRVMEAELGKELEAAVMKVAKKAGFE